MFPFCSYGGTKGRVELAHADANQNEETLWLKRQALQIVMQLPDEKQDALRVLGFARDLVLDYLNEDEAMPQEGAEIVRLVVP